MYTSLNNFVLGKKSDYINQYNPNLLFPIPRAIKRTEIGIDDKNLGFVGEDLWTHYEISWLNQKGKPCVAIGEISYPAYSENIIESKSMKLYFNSFNGIKFANKNEIENLVIKDLSNVIKATAKFKLIELSEGIEFFSLKDYACIDNLDIECNKYQPEASYLQIENANIVHEKLYSNLLKSNCLVTNQPDWGTVFIEYSGKKINLEGLLRYIISLREHNEFHEQCVERIFNDITKQCNPTELTVYARYTRRGGLDINPFRTTNQDYTISNNKLVRQ